MSYTARFMHDPHIDCGVAGCTTGEETLGLYPIKQGRIAAAAAKALTNPEGGDTWYHGAAFGPYHDIDGQDLSDDEAEENWHGGKIHAPDMDEYETGQHADKHWNVGLGAHFTSLKHVARQFAEQGQRYGGSQARILHAGLHMSHPAVFEDEHEMGKHAVKWAHNNGYKFVAPYAEKGAKPTERDYKNYSTGDIYDEDDSGEQPLGHLDYTTGLSPHKIIDIDKHGVTDKHHVDDVDQYLNYHPNRQEIVEGWRDHLRSKGYDGILYGNSKEGPDKHACAITFDDTEIHHRKWEWMHKDDRDSYDPKGDVYKPGNSGDFTKKDWAHRDGRTPYVAKYEPWEAHIHGPRTEWMNRTEQEHRLHLERQRDEAEKATNGNMVSPAGRAMGITSEDFFKPGNRRSIERWGTDEMKRWAGSENAPQAGETSQLGKLYTSLADYRRHVKDQEQQAYYDYQGGHHDFSMSTEQARHNDDFLSRMFGNKTGIHEHVLDSFEPTERLFAPTKGNLDPRFFDERRHLHPEVRQGIMGAVYANLIARGYAGMDQWLRVYFAGSQASEWWGNGDLDLLLGVEYNRFRQFNPDRSSLSNEEINSEFNVGFRDTFNGAYWLVVNYETWHQDDSSATNRSLASFTSTPRPQLPPTTSQRTLGSASIRSVATSNWQAYPAICDVEDVPLSSASPRFAETVAPSTQSASRLGDAKPAPRSTTAGITSNGTWGSASNDTTNSSNAKTAHALYASGWWKEPSQSTMITSVAQAGLPAGSAYAVSYVTDATALSASSETPIWLGPLDTSTEPSLPEGLSAIGPLDRTAYVNANSWDIRDIKPYAAYNVTDDTWAVKPIHEPNGHEFDSTEWYYFEGIAAQARHALGLKEPARTRACTNLWNFIHKDRGRAFGPDGSGAFDRANALEKYLSQYPAPGYPDGLYLMDLLREAKYGKPSQHQGMVSYHHESTRGQQAQAKEVSNLHRVSGVQDTGSVRGHEEYLQGMRQQAAGGEDEGSAERRHTHGVREVRQDVPGVRVQQDNRMPGVQREVLPRVQAAPSGERSRVRREAASVPAESASQEDLWDHAGAVRGQAGGAGREVSDLWGDQRGVRQGVSVRGSQPQHRGAEGSSVRSVQPLGEGPGRRSRTGKEGAGVRREASSPVDLDQYPSPDGRGHLMDVLRGAKYLSQAPSAWPGKSLMAALADFKYGVGIAAKTAGANSNLPEGYSLKVTHHKVENPDVAWNGMPRIDIQVHHDVDGVVGYIGAHQRLDENGSPFIISHVAVAPEHQLKGIATAMYGELHHQWPGMPVVHSEHRSDAAKALTPHLRKTFGPDMHLGAKTASSDWREITYPTGATARHSTTDLGNGYTMGHEVSGTYGSVNIFKGERIPASMTYSLKDSPTTDGRTLPSVFVNYVEVDKDHRGKGLASKMYDAVRGTHPDRVIPAADVLEGPGKRLVKHLRETHPDVHMGRFDTDGVIHPTSGPDDSAYRPAMLKGKTAATSPQWEVTRTAVPGSVSTRMGHQYDLTATNADGEEQGTLRYRAPKRKGAPIHVDDVQSDVPGVGSHLLNHMESLHPEASRTVFLNEDRRRDKNTPSHTTGDHGKPTDWDQHFDAISDIHRGVTLRLDSYDARRVNSDASPEDHARVLMSQLDRSRAGTHWTSNQKEAQNFAQRNRYDYRTDIPVVLHAARPERKDIETRPSELLRNVVFPYDGVEQEVPVRKGRSVSLKGISWKPDVQHPDADENGWLHHTFTEPFTKSASFLDDKAQAYATRRQASDNGVQYISHQELRNMYSGDYDSPMGKAHGSMLRDWRDYKNGELDQDDIHSGELEHGGPTAHIRHLQDDIAQNGLKEPLVIRGGNVVVDGNHRGVAALNLRLDKIPVRHVAHREGGSNDMATKSAYATRHHSTDLTDDGRAWSQVKASYAARVLGVPMARVASEDDDWHMDHRPPGPEDGAPAHDLTGNGMYPKDVYSNMRMYDFEPEHSSESIASLHRVKGRPDAKIKVYRAMPAEHAHKGIQPGDWVSTSKSYAMDHSRVTQNTADNWPVISATVRADEIHSEGNSLNEWGYNGPGPSRHTVAYGGGANQRVRAHADGAVHQVQHKDNPIEGYKPSMDPSDYDDFLAGRGGVTVNAPDGSQAAHMSWDRNGVTDHYVHPDHEHVGDHLFNQMRLYMPKDTRPPRRKVTASYAERVLAKKNFSVIR